MTAESRYSTDAISHTKRPPNRFLIKIVSHKDFAKLSWNVICIFCFRVFLTEMARFRGQLQRWRIDFRFQFLKTPASFERFVLFGPVMSWTISRLEPGF